MSLTFRHKRAQCHKQTRQSKAPTTGLGTEPDDAKVTGSIRGHTHGVRIVEMMSCQTDFSANDLKKKFVNSKR